jgi:hypothetical protein
MRIGLITTLNTNIGDDLIRTGVCLILRDVFKGHEVEFVPVNKHRPLTVYPQWHPIHSACISRCFPTGRSKARRLIERAASKLQGSLFDACQLIVQCGAPVLWAGCHQCEWAGPLWHDVVGRLHHRIPVLNLAAGSCYPWERQPIDVSDSQDSDYLKAILDYCRLTTVRDVLAQRLLASLGTQTPLLVCSALLGLESKHDRQQEDGIVLLNYMHGGGHYDWDQGIDPYTWRSTTHDLIKHLKKRHRLAFLCHDETEYKMAYDLAPTLPRLYPSSPQEYFTVTCEAKIAICNRMHASVALAGIGIPSIAVGTDTRLLMVHALGLPCYYVKDTSVEILEEEIEKLMLQRRQEYERLRVLRLETWNEYIKRVSDAIN